MCDIDRAAWFVSDILIYWLIRGRGCLPECLMYSLARLVAESPRTTCLSLRSQQDEFLQRNPVE